MRSGRAAVWTWGGTRVAEVKVWGRFVHAGALLGLWVLPMYATILGENAAVKVLEMVGQTLWRGGGQRRSLRRLFNAVNDGSLIGMG